jgi:hypothetical protein
MHHPLHATHSDSASWQAALAGLTGISPISGTLSTFNHSSAMRRKSDGGQVNGSEAIHYSIDTARWDQSTREMLGSVTLGPGGFDKGDAWVVLAPLARPDLEPQGASGHRQPLISGLSSVFARPRLTIPSRCSVLTPSATGSVSFSNCCPVSSSCKGRYRVRSECSGG